MCLRVTFSFPNIALRHCATPFSVPNPENDSLFMNERSRNLLYFVEFIICISISIFGVRPNVPTRSSLLPPNRDLCPALCVPGRMTRSGYNNVTALRCCAWICIMVFWNSGSSEMPIPNLKPPDVVRMDVSIFCYFFPRTLEMVCQSFKISWGSMPPDHPSSGSLTRSLQPVFLVAAYG